MLNAKDDEEESRPRSYDDSQPNEREDIKNKSDDHVQV